ncbi:Platelet-activating factor acetylhydrolase, isoform II [Amycolatopsis xylanica]|uniref:Platelet-activating factor acetylhydrolase, isoform II n=1 Tax=Amycolatopsis xylanica TaxID=589385 RepID=A0A1H2VIP1_9PSEU|nr:hypothetical protein [Amycolatopsis xylanica]SDW68226.1 Platelet-activating factor acetylhydrolase, isoform II [Amycolatopsis xylanica]
MKLPEPSGRTPIGQITLHLRDVARPDPWLPHDRRELMVSIWYPALVETGRQAPYLTLAESERIAHGLSADIAGDALTTVGTHARVNAPPLGSRAPLVVLSPGRERPRGTLRTLGEDLASQGYVVAAIGHNHEAVATTFPDGRTTGCLARDDVKIARGRAADVSFVLDRLIGKTPVWGRGKLIDPRRIAMVGHSIGGGSVLPAMLADPRISAGVTLDGSFPVLAGLNRPLLLLGTPRHAPGGQADPSWDRLWPGLTGWKRWLTVERGGPSMCTDLPMLADQLGLPPDQKLPAARGLRITRDYVTAFLDLHLRGRPQPLLARPSPRFPEVKFWRP